MLNSALDLLHKLDKPSRNRKLHTEAQQLLSLKTDEEDPQVDSIPLGNDDQEYLDDTIGVGEGHVPSQQTMQKKVDMHDGTNGQRRRSGSYAAEIQKDTY